MKYIATFSLLSLLSIAACAAEPAIATFSADVTPPIGAPLCDGLVPPADSIDDPLFARGIVLFGDDKPILLCAVDWVGIGNTGHDRWQEELAKAAGTTADRVAVHCLHQHDAPGYDEMAEELLAQQGLSGKQYHVTFAREAIKRVADAVKISVAKKQPITHYGVGKAEVKEVASNRRVMGPDGKVKYVRYSSCKDEKIRAEPEGTIDPMCRIVAFYNGDKPVASLTYYATHPQSYYGQGNISSDFPGLARGLRDKEQPEVFHAHFNGAGGNVTAGKYNDGSPPLRMILAQRLAKGMKEAWEDADAHRQPLAAKAIGWAEVGVVLPPRDIIDEKTCLSTLSDASKPEKERIRAARDLAFKRRCDSGHKTILGCLKLGTTRVLHLPGEIFIEYQLAAQKMYPTGEVCTAGYGDYGGGYIGTKIAYTQGGYETSYVSRTAPEVEDVLIRGITEVLAK